MNSKHLRSFFPLLNNPLSGQPPLAYLDNAATTQKPKPVIDAICNFYTTANANIHRGLYKLAEDATTLYENTRRDVARFIHAQHPREIVFTKGTTEGINLLVQSWAKLNLKSGEGILLSAVEHHANLLPWVEFAREHGLFIRYIRYNKASKKLLLEGLNLEGIKLLAVQHTSNVLGNVWNDDFSNLSSLITAIHKQDGAVLIDAAQSIAHLPINVQDLNTDFLVFSGHKMYAPTGIGVIYINRRWHNQLLPFHMGGSMLYNATYEGGTWAKMPQLLEAGTPPIAGAIGLQAAIDFLTQKISFPTLIQHETALCKKLAFQLEKIPGISVVTEHEHSTRQHIVSFYHASIHAHDIASLLGEKNIAVRAGNHCAQPLVDLIGVPALVRVSVGMYTIDEEIERFVTTLQETLNHLTI